MGCRLHITTKSGRQTRLVALSRGYMSSGEAVEHFGLGEDTRVDSLRVSWPSGIEQEFRDLPAGQLYTIREEPPTAERAPAQRPTAPTPLLQSVPSLPVQHTEREFDDYAAQPLLPHRLSRLGPGMAWGDVDGDGREECWVEIGRAHV